MPEGSGLRARVRRGPWTPITHDDGGFEV